MFDCDKDQRYATQVNIHDMSAYHLDCEHAVGYLSTKNEGAGVNFGSYTQAIKVDKLTSLF